MCYNDLAGFQVAEWDMFAIEFQSRIRNGVIEVPAEYRERLRRESEGDVVRVIVLTGEMAEEQDPSARPDVLDELLANPIRVKDFKPLNRDETHDRR